MKKKLDADEFGIIYQAMKKAIDDDLATALVQGTWGQSPITTATSPSRNPYLSPSHYMGISPTDVDAKGKYEYQEPEKDERGTYYGYKVLHKCTMSSCREHGGLISPRYQVHWSENGELQADKVPAEDSMFGIHFTKRPDHPELRQYYGRFHGAAYTYNIELDGDGSEISVLVKCALSGTIVETEQGFRAEHAQIVGVFINGNWQSYQDYQERTRAYSRPIPEPWEEDWKVNYRLTYGKPLKGNWNNTFYADWNTNGDS